MDTGGLAQMTYNMSINTGSLGVPGSGFASRGKGSHIKRLSVPHPSKVEPRDESLPHTASTPRTSRSHLLAGLRTAPKQPSTPSTAPLLQQAHRLHGFPGVGAHYSSHSNPYANVPQTATGASFYRAKGSASFSPSPQVYSLPEHVLGPPALDHILEERGEPIDENLYAELVSTNLYLAAQQERLQQQLASVTAAAQHFQSLNLGSPVVNQQQYLSNGAPSMSFYQQQAQHGMQPVVQPVPGRPGVFSVYNPMTGQQNFVVDNSVQIEESYLPTHADDRHPHTNHPSAYRGDASQSPESRHSPVRSQPSSSPSSRIPTPPRDAQRMPPALQQSHAPVPAKRDHKKNLSLAVKFSNEGPKTSTPKSAGFPSTPATGTFGPGQARAGEHAIRQPRGPPPLEELVSKPTSKHEGSKNFVTRQRRKAVHSLVRARMERRGEPRDSTHSSSAGSITPSSETDYMFSPSDVDDPSTANSSLSGKPSLGSLRAAANGAIGSERKDKDMTYGSKPSTENLYGATVNGSEAYVADSSHQLPRHRKMPMLVLSNAEKRRSPIL
ncbi:hypothetical protein FQN57_005725 [Myotisia sp. PD_48]|nr:hypothetical protein FQN57_005725 [Myotisia sp. PD_48]